MENLSFSEFLKIAGRCGKPLLWLPVIEIYQEKTPDGTKRVFGRKAFWIENASGCFERFDWDEKFGAFIDASGFSFCKAFGVCEKVILSRLPRPYFGAFEADYFLYSLHSWQTLSVLINRCDELLNGRAGERILTADERRFFGLSLSQKGSRYEF